MPMEKEILVFSSTIKRSTVDSADKEPAYKELPVIKN